MSAPNPKNVLAGLLRAAGHPDATPGAIELTGTAPVLPSSFAVDAAAQATIAAAALAANELWRLRTGRRQGVKVDRRSAAIEFRSERYLRLDGKPPSEYHDPIAGLYRCGDDGPRTSYGWVAGLEDGCPRNARKCYPSATALQTAFMRARPLGAHGGSGPGDGAASLFMMAKPIAVL